MGCETGTDCPERIGESELRERKERKREGVGF
jgi:hypothetical protein